MIDKDSKKKKLVFEGNLIQRALFFIYNFALFVLWDETITLRYRISSHPGAPQLNIFSFFNSI